MLDVLRLRGEVLCVSELSAAWGLGFAPDETLFFHVVESGRCVVRPEGGAWTELHAGDLAVLPNGRGHVLASDARSAVVPIDSLVDPAGALPGHLRTGGGGARARVLCGRFRSAGLDLLPVPPVLLVRGHGGRAPRWLRSMLGLLGAEARARAPGRAVAMSRLVDLVLVQALRHWIERDAELPSGWMRAARDPRIARALSRLHSAPADRWSVPRLAKEAGMSRSSFAERFVALVGEPPSRYLTRWRIHLARRLLARPGMGVAEVAARVGYDSEAAFSRAFRRVLSVSPGSISRPPSGTGRRAPRPRAAR